MGHGLSERLAGHLAGRADPVSTASLVRALGAARSGVWAALLRLERAGKVVRDTRPVRPGAPAPCPCCGRPLPAPRANHARETFWRAAPTGAIVDLLDDFDAVL